MTISIQNPQARQTLEFLYADARRNDPAVRERLLSQDAPGTSAFARFEARKELYMPVDAEFGHLMYGLIRSAGARTAVEFGTSFGVSTLFLAAALRETGGRLVTTEFIAEKSATARKNLAQAGLEDVVDFRVGDALESLRDRPVRDVDFVFLDGEKSLYLDFLKLLEPSLKPGCVIATDNTDHEGAETLLAYLRDPRHGYVSSSVLTPGPRGGTRAHELSFRM